MILYKEISSFLVLPINQRSKDALSEGGGLNEGSQCAFGCSIRHMTLQLLRSHCCHWIYCCCVLFVVVLVALYVCW